MDIVVHLYSQEDIDTWAQSTVNGMVRSISPLHELGTLCGVTPTLYYDKNTTFSMCPSCLLVSHTNGEDPLFVASAYTTSNSPRGMLHVKVFNEATGHHRTDVYRVDLPVARNSRWENNQLVKDT